MDAAEDLRQKVRGAYSSVADQPQEPAAFPVGRQFAESLGYPQELLAELSAASVESFAGVSNVSLFAEIAVDAKVLDLGCGAGLDSLIAARRVGSRGIVAGVDFSAAMLRRARLGACEAGMANVMLCQADAERLPLGTASMDLALVNGIFNLNPAREAIFHELGRVVRRGGAVYAAELILSEPLPPHEEQSEANWFAWIAGAKEGVAILQEFRAAGFEDVTILRTLRNARTKHPGVVAAEIRAIRGADKIKVLL